MSIAPVLVSVVTPCLNGMRYLPAVIESVRNQTHPAVEHIVIDGGSTDGTVDYLEAQKDIRWVSEPDRGMYDAINKGLALASGEIFAYLNADDSYLPHSVAVAVAALEEAPETGFVYGDLLNLDPTTGRGSIFFLPPYDKAAVQRGGLIPQPTVFVRRSALDEVGPFDDAFRFAGDLDRWTRIAERYPAKHIDEVLAVEREHPGRFTARADLVEARVAEKKRIVARYRRSETRLQLQLLRRRDLVRESFYYRRSMARFAMAMNSGHHAPGRRWGGFIGMAGSLQVRVDRKRLLVGMVPVLGRRSKDFVEASL